MLIIHVCVIDTNMNVYALLGCAFEILSACGITEASF